MSDELNKVINKKYKINVDNGDKILNTKEDILSISPALDEALGGGIPTGTFSMLYGPPKCGKSTAALSLAKSFQEIGGLVYYLDVENRIKRKNLEGIQGLNVDAIQHIHSDKKKFLTTEDYVNLATDVLNFEDDDRKKMIIFDSISSMCELAISDADIEKNVRSGNGRILSQFFQKSTGSVRPYQNMVVSICHGSQSQDKYDPGYKPTGGIKVIYQADTILQFKKRRKWLEGDKCVGQECRILVEESALGPPHMELSAFLRYGIGFDRIKEAIEAGKSINLIEQSKSGGFYDCVFLHNHTNNSYVKKFIEEQNKPIEKMFKVRGGDNLVYFFEDHPEFRSLLETDIKKITCG